MRSPPASNITYKILYNDAVAMTGGQHHEGGLTVDAIARQVRAEGVGRIALVSDEPDKYPPGMQWPAGTTFHHRSELDAVQRELRDVKGVSVLLYDQTCAAEKRRRRKRGTYPDPDKRVIINELVCEGCGDCGIQSNCVSVQPVDTEYGRKRRIDQSSCNKDFSCIEGFCPSFVTVHGGRIKKAGGAAQASEPLKGVPDAPAVMPDNGWACVITGVGGTGVVTIGAILGMAAHLEGKGCGMIDMAGLAQKGGAVFSHVRISEKPEDIAAIRVPAGKADLVLGCDLVVSGSRKVLASVREGETLFIANTAEIMPGDFARNADFSLPVERLKRTILKTAGEDRTVYFDGTRAATALFGNAIAANMFMLGLACQRGGLPVSAEAVERAVQLNGQAAEMNVAAFRWGRRAAHDPAAVRALMEAVHKPTRAQQLSQTPQEAIDRRHAFLTAYQNRKYANRFMRRIERIMSVDETLHGQPGALTDAAARNLFKLMAIKDEYEVARLYSNGSFMTQLQDQFDSWDSLEFHLAPPVLAKRDENGHLRKRRFGPSMMRVFSLLASLRGIRGSVLDPFARQAERRTERRLLADYEALLDELIADTTADNYEAAVALLNYPQHIRGFGHVKERSITVANSELAALKRAFADGEAAVQEAAE